MKKKISQLITFFTLVGFVIYFFNNLNEFKPLLGIDIVYLIIIIVLYLLTFVTSAFVYKVFFDNFNKKIGFFECFDFTIFSSIANLLVPFRGGAVIRAVYFKKEYDLSYSKFISMLGGTYVISFIVLAGMGLLGLILIKPVFNFKLLGLTLTFVVILFGALVVSFYRGNFKFSVFQKLPDKVQKFLGIIKQIAESWYTINKSKKLVWFLILLVAINFLLTILITKFEFLSIGTDLSLAQLFLYSSLSGLSIFLSFTPSALGIREVMFLLLSDVLFITNQEVLNIAVIDRGVLILILFVLYLILKLKKYLNVKIIENNSKK